MFREAAAGLWVEAEGVRRGRRLTEYRRRSTLLQCLRPEEQERLRQLSFSVLQQNSQQPAAGLNPQLLYDSYKKGECETHTAVIKLKNNFLVAFFCINFFP